MKVVLICDVKGQGKKGDLINVSEGYAKNFLLPRKLAKKVDAQVITEMKNAENARQYKIETERKTAQDIANRLNGKEIVIFSKAGDKGKLFGAVTSKEIAEKIKTQFSIKVDKRKIKLDADIKSFGKYSCEIKLYTGVTCNMYVAVCEMKQ